MAVRTGDTPQRERQRMLRTPPPVSRSRPEVPAWVVRLVDRLLRPQPAHRLQDGIAVVAAIDAREVPRDWRHAWSPRRAAWAAGAVAALALAAAGGWWLERGTTVPLAKADPLDRLLVMPVQSEDLPTVRAIALGAHLRNAFAARDGIAVVDAERTLQAQRQLGATGAAAGIADARSPFPAEIINALGQFC